MKLKKTIGLINFILSVFLPFNSSKIFADNRDLYSLNTASFVYHVYAPKEGNNEYFNNELFSIERRMDESSDYTLFAGTLINSESNRCILLGVGKNWANYNDWSIEGMYAYAGEFIFEPFSHCGEGGFYQDLKNATGVGFAPYIYHGVKYNLTPHVSLRSGILLPGIVVLSLQLRF
jgi:hypothetical protein